MVSTLLFFVHSDVITFKNVNKNQYYKIFVLCKEISFGLILILLVYSVVHHICMFLKQSLQAIPKQITCRLVHLSCTRCFGRCNRQRPRCNGACWLW